MLAARADTFRNYIRRGMTSCAKPSAPLEAEGFARENVFECARQRPRYRKISSPSPAGAMKIFFVNKVQAYLLLYSARYFLKGNPSLAPIVFHSGNPGGRDSFYPCLVSSGEKKRNPPRPRNSVCKKKSNGHNTSRNLIRVTRRNSSDCTRNARCIKATNVKYECYAGGARKSYLSSQGA